MRKRYPFAEQALSIAKGLFGRKDAKVAILLDNLAVLYNSQSEFSVAENYYEQALSVREEALGSRHPDWRPASTGWRYSTIRKNSILRPSLSINVP